MQRKKNISGDLRQPIVTILGHVDHGKTTLLDFIRKSNVAKKEAGGITQRIGAYIVKTKEGKEITFIDTPGHAAFSKMRERGVSAADIIILVVSSIDGVMPQTREALDYIKKAEIPFIVAITKIDLPSANFDQVKNQLQKEGVNFEGSGGDVPVVAVSGKTGEGVDELLETINLVAEVNNLTKIENDAKFDGVVIETGKDKRGITASLVVRKGTIKVGDEVFADNIKTHVRGLFNYLNESIKSAKPGEPVLMLGFSNSPDVGSRIEKIGKNQFIENLSIKDKGAVSKKVQDGKISIILKAQTSGSLEAIEAGLSKDVEIVSDGVGEVNESDIFLAKSSNSLIFCFESKITSIVRKLAEEEGVIIESFDIIYKLFERIDEILKKGEVEVVGEAEIIATFPFENKKVAGCKITNGKITRLDDIILEREGQKLGSVKINSIKKGKKDIEEVKQGEECGILFTPQLDFKEGDMLLSVRN